MHEDRGRPAFTVVADVHIEVQAVEGKRAQLGGAPADTGEQLHRGGDGGACEFVETMKVLGFEQLIEHDLRQRPADLVVAATGTWPLARADHDVVGQQGRLGAGVGQAHLPTVSKEPGQMVQAARAHRRRQDAHPFQVRQAGEERVDVTMAQGIRAQPGVGAFEKRADGRVVIESVNESQALIEITLRLRRIGRDLARIRSKSLVEWFLACVQIEAAHGQRRPDN